MHHAIGRQAQIAADSATTVRSTAVVMNAADPRHNVVIVQLKSGQIFSGTVDRLSRYSHDGPKYYYFSNLAWLDEDKRRWQKRDDGIIVERNEIEYIETPRLID